MLSSMPANPLSPSYLDKYSLSTSSLECNAFLVLWSICLSSSPVHFRKGPEYLLWSTAQVFITLIRFRLEIIIIIIIRRRRRRRRRRRTTTTTTTATTNKRRTRKRRTRMLEEEGESSKKEKIYSNIWTLSGKRGLSELESSCCMRGNCII